MALAMRNEVPEEQKWDLSLIYKTEEDMYADFEKGKALAKKLVENYKGKLTTADAIVSCVKDLEEIRELFYLVGSYNNLHTSVDYYDTYLMEREAKVNNEMTQVDTELSFVSSEILQADEAVIKEAIEKSEARKNFLADLLREKPHRLSPETEKALTALSHSFQAPYELYNVAKLADMKFPSFTVNGKEYPLGYSLFEDDYEYENDTDVRRAAFNAFSEKIR